MFFQMRNKRKRLSCAGQERTQGSPLQRCFKRVAESLMKADIFKYIRKVYHGACLHWIGL